MKEKKQTAVEWLLERIENKNGKEFSSYYSEFINQAKEMEKEQIEDAHYQGYRNFIDTTEISEKYYNETYGGEQ